MSINYLLSVEKIKRLVRLILWIVPALIYPCALKRKQSISQIYVYAFLFCIFSLECASIKSANRPPRYVEKNMKKTALLNSQLSYEIARLGHTDSLTVCDAGLPIPRNLPFIDLALTGGIPTFLDTLEIISTEMVIERVVVATEMQTQNPTVHTALLQWLNGLTQSQQHPIVIEYTSHQQFKQLTQQSQAIIRTGECTPFSNIILYAGVAF